VIEVLGERQKQLLRLLLRNKPGMTVDELSAGLHVTRNAVRQHVTALQKDGLVGTGPTRPSGGRPQQLFVLTEKGKEAFPRHYSWFGRLILEAIRREYGDEGLRERLTKIGGEVARQLRDGSKSPQGAQTHVEELAALMNDLGYDARTTQDASAPVIEADNCVFHELAMADPKVCEFDLALLAGYTGKNVVHQKCMARGDNVCRFRFVNKK
jgi:predicted ArsR family transcriptional regulator